MDRLSVWFQGLRAGALDYDERTNSFTLAYDPDYLARTDAAALSVSLPLREAAYDPYVSRKFFENLLPPEVVRRKLELVLHISVGNVFGCLKALGRDCAGAISVYPDDERPDETADEQLLELSDAEAEAAILSLPQRPLLIGAYDGFRMSAAGAQDKLIARIRQGKLVLPLFGAASTDIIKPEVARFGSAGSVPAGLKSYPARLAPDSRAQRDGRMPRWRTDRLANAREARRLGYGSPLGYFVGRPRSASTGTRASK